MKNARGVSVYMMIDDNNHSTPLLIQVSPDISCAYCIVLHCIFLLYICHYLVPIFMKGQTAKATALGVITAIILVTTIAIYHLQSWL